MKKIESIQTCKLNSYSHFAFLIAHVQMITRPSKVPIVHMIATPDTAKITSSETTADSEFSMGNAKSANVCINNYVL